MKYALMQDVVIQSDTLNLGLPVGKTAYVVLVETEFWVPGCDLIPADEYIAQATESVLRESLIDHALRTGNKALFEQQVSASRRTLS
jgi:hypothetical protein